MHLSDLFEFEEWSRMTPVNNALDLLQSRAGRGTPVNELISTTIVEAVVREAMSMSQEKLAAFYYTTSGVQYLFWLHVRNNPGNPTLDACRGVVNDENKAWLWALLSEVSAFLDPFGIKTKETYTTPEAPNPQ